MQSVQPPPVPPVPPQTMMMMMPMMMNSLVGDLGRGTYYLPLLSLLRKAAERCTCGSFVRSLPAMELPSSQTPFCAAPKAGPHTTHTHTHAHTHQECRWWASIRSSRSPFQDLPCSQPSHSHTDTYAHTHTYSLSRSLSLFLYHCT